MGIFGVTQCPECDSSLSPTDSDDSRPVQTITQSCNSCSYETTIGLLWYGHRGYEVVSDVSGIPSAKKGVCDKTDGFVVAVVIPMDHEEPTYYSTESIRAHHKEAISSI